MSEFVFYKVVPVLFSIVLLFGATGILSAILSIFYNGKRVGNIFDNILFVSLIGAFSNTILLLLTFSISGLIILCNF